MCYFFNKRLAKFARKRTTYVFFMIYCVLDNTIKNTELKNKPSSLIVMILQYTKNLSLKFFSQYNDIGNLKIL